MYKSPWFILVSICILILGGAGVITKIYSKGESTEKSYTLIEKSFAVSNSNDVAYIPMGQTKKKILVYDIKDNTKRSEIPYKGDIADMVFSKDGNTLYFAANDVISNDKLSSSLYKTNLSSGDTTKITEVPAIVMKIQVDAAEKQILYMRANHYIDLKGITGEVRSSFEAYLLNLSTHAEQQITHFKDKEITGLSYNSGETGALISVDHSILEIPFNNIEKLNEVFKGDNVIFDLAAIPNTPEIIYTLPGKAGQGVYKYELYKVNTLTNTSVKLTNSNHAVSNPILNARNELYYVVDNHFGEGNPEYQLYHQKLKTKMKPQKIELPSININ
ncbi:TolB family protein [Falsibacillus pallidus]|uniref:TolB protein n=1 Tax=Falsibacillus pallidus TaxID=493781 RepID=A0A370GHU0_9BACI|nr:hypothetical protein [Falsibacillus pallidus]RDI41944.1 hypothetical protein DFR59_106103 [Falsibacillus pallidus]